MPQTHPQKLPASSGAETPLPLVAPCWPLTLDAPWRWIRLGWGDLKRAPGQSLGYGLVLVLLSYLMTAVAFRLGGYVVLFSLLSGFVFLAPLIAIGLYDISCQLDRGHRPSLGHCLRESRRHLGNLMVFAVMLLIVFLVWARAASMVHVFFPVESGPQWTDIALFLGVGSVIGSIFAAVVFSASAFALPMIMDRKVDAVTAAITSVNAVLRNRWVMLIWVGLILAGLLIGFLTAYLGLAVTLPLLGHATWHAYRETVDGSAWPAQEERG